MYYQFNEENDEEKPEFGASYSETNTYTQGDR